MDDNENEYKERENSDLESNLDKDSKKEYRRKLKIRLKKRNIIFIVGVVLLVFFVMFLFYFLAVPKLSLTGDSYVKIEYGDYYSEDGYKASYLGKDLTDKVWIDGEIDSNKTGVYELKYKIRKNRITVTKVRKIEIVDSKKPVITLEGDKSKDVCPNFDYKEDGFSAIDNYDGDITSFVKREEKDDGIHYFVKDSSGNEEEVIRHIRKIDSGKPTITLKGGNVIYVTVNSKYNENGYTATDECDGDLTNKVIVKGNVDSSKVGKYTVTYTVKDTSNNESVATREVNVVKEVATGEPVKGAIYLTFDDGPSATITPKLLDLLKEKNVKATFFVINHSDNLNYLIKREFDEGHTVGLHSYTHQYSSVYSSVDAYFDDLDKISKKVESITGQKSMIIRFPGGGSNTVSRKYSKGIMTTLTNEVLNRGYHYFDWNVSSGDAGDVKTKEEVYNMVTKSLSKKRSNIILMHDFESNYKTLNALSDIIDYARANGYEFKTIDMSTAMVRHKVNN